MKEESKRKNAPNINEFVRSEFRNVRHFYGIDFHQDAIDFVDREPDYVTLYLYLDEVTEKESPLILLPCSHLAGADVYPHDLTWFSKDGMWIFKTDSNRQFELKHRMLTGSPGSVYFWHGLMLHGTLPNSGPAPRISLRYIFEKSPQDSGTVVERINKKIPPPLTLPKTVNPEKGKSVRAVDQLLSV